MSTMTPIDKQAINSLLARAESAEARVKELEAERDRLREALRPFAAVSDEFRGARYEIDLRVACSFYVEPKHFKPSALAAAKEALVQKGGAL